MKTSRKKVAKQFQPERIILFGSHATGQQHADSDVDILVVMPARNQLDQAAKIHLATLPPFPLHLIVRTPDNFAWRLAEGDSFLQEVVSKGKVLYEKAKGGCGMGSECSNGTMTDERFTQATQSRDGQPLCEKTATLSQQVF